MKKVLIKIISETETNTDIAFSAPCVCVVNLTKDDVDRILRISRVVKESGIDYACFNGYSLSNPIQWLDNRPLYSFEELGEKYIYSTDSSFDRELTCELSDNYDPEKQTCESVYGVVVRVSELYVYIEGYCDYSGAPIETSVVSIDYLQSVVNDPNPVEKLDYYIDAEAAKEMSKEDQDSITIEDLPKYLNTKSVGLKKFITEALKHQKLY